MSRRVVVSARSELRLREATAWLAAREPGREVLGLGATTDAAGEVIRAGARARGSAFGMHRFTLGRLAAELAKHELVERDRADHLAGRVGGRAEDQHLAPGLARSEPRGRLANAKLRARCDNDPARHRPPTL